MQLFNETLKRNNFVQIVVNINVINQISLIVIIKYINLNIFFSYLALFVRANLIKILLLKLQQMSQHCTLQNAKRHKVIATNIYERYFFICDIRVSVEQNQFKEIIFIRQNLVLYYYQNFENKINNNNKTSFNFNNLFYSNIVFKLNFQLCFQILIIFDNNFLSICVYNYTFKINNIYSKQQLCFQIFYNINFLIEVNDSYFVVYFVLKIH